MEKKLGAVPISDDILEKSKIGLWAFELDEGMPPRMYGDEGMHELLCASKDASPEELYHAWYDHIDPKCIKLVEEAVEKMRSGEHAEVQYPWISPIKGETFVRCGGTRNFAYTLGARIEGCHQDVTELIHFQADTKREYLEIIEGVTEDYEIIVHVDFDTGEEVHYRMSPFFSEIYDEIKEDEKDFLHAQKYIGKYIYEEDREEVRRKLNLDYIEKEVKKNHTISAEYRMVKKGRICWMETTVIKHSEHKNRNCAILMVRDITKIKEAEEKRIQEMAVIAGLSEDYSYVTYIEPNSLKDTVYKNRGDIVVSPDKKESLSFSEKIEYYANTYVHPDDRERFLQETLPEIVLINVNGSPSYFVVYRTVVDGVIHHNQIKFVADYRDGKIVGIVAGFTNRDSEIERSRIREIKERRSAQIIRNLSEDYDYVCYVENDTNEISRVHISDKILNVIKDYDLSMPGNRRFDKMLKDIILPTDFPDFLKATDRTLSYAKLQKDGFYEIDFRVKLEKKIHYYRIKMALDQFNKDGVVLGLYCVDAEKKAKEELEKAKEKAEAANKAKTTFLFSMSHDIRTPMNAIKGFSAMAQKYSNNHEKVVECLEKIDIASEQLLSLVNQVLDMSRIEANEITLDISSADIIERAYGMLTVVEAAAKQKGISLGGEIKNLKCKDVYTDAARMNQIIINILGNAVKYTPEGGSVIYTVEQIDCDKPGYGTYVFTVKDTGIGMSKEYLSRIYDVFSREKNTTLSKVEGTGLGMAIVKRLVDIMGGTIDIKSKLGEGTTVKVTITFKLVEGTVSKKPTSQEITVEDLNGKRILLAEDNEMNREIAKDILEDYGILVDEATDGDEALSMVMKNPEGFYDCILMDIQMPTMDGYEATKKIRKLKETKKAKVPIIAMTANAFEEDRVKALEAGMDAHIAKPFDIIKLLDTLGEII